MKRGILLILVGILVISFIVSVSAVCTDSDNGIDVDTAGVTSGTFVFDDGVIDENYTVRDFCPVAGGSFKYVGEGYCDGENVKEQIIECPTNFTCNEGACTESAAIFENPEIFINKTLLARFVSQDVGDWTFKNDSIQVGNSYSECLQENITSYLGDHYLEGGGNAKVMFVDYPAEIENTDFLRDIIKCLVSQDLSFKIKTSGENSYFYAETKATSTSSDGSTRTFTDAHYLWYNGNKIVYILLEKGYPVQDLLTAYFDKYPSQVVAPPSLIQRITDFFRRLFGG